MTGRELKELRLSKGLTQLELARKLQARGQATISEWESQENPRISKPYLLLLEMLKEDKL